MKKESILLVVVVAFLALVALFFFLPKNSSAPGQPAVPGQDQVPMGEVVDFQTCMEAGFAVMESHPRQCITADGRNFVEELPEEIPGEQFVGGDSDEHGCIGSAGYSWCEPKSKCLIIWEEQCYTSVEEELEYLLAEKHGKMPQEVKVTIYKQLGDFVSGGVMFGEGGPGEGGMLLASKVDNVWQVVFDGNGNPDCGELRGTYGFPDEILSPNFCD